MNTLETLKKYRVYEGTLLLALIAISIYTFTVKQNALEYTDQNSQTIIKSTITIQTKTKENIKLNKIIEQNKAIIETNKKKLEQFNLFYKD